MQFQRRTVYRYLVALTLGVLLFLGWLSLASLLTIKNIAPISMAAVWTRSGNFLAALIIGLLTYDCTKSIWKPLACVGIYLLILIAASFFCGGPDISELWKVIVSCVCGFCLCVLLKNKRAGKRKKGRKRAMHTRQIRKNATR